MIPKAVEEFIDKVDDVNTWDWWVREGVLDVFAEYLITDPDSPVRKLIEAAKIVINPMEYTQEEYRMGRDDLEQALAAFKEK